jgi:hypothetical protein
MAESPRASLAPATAGDLAWVADLQRELFGAHAIPLPILRAWHRANPNGFHIVQADGERIGHIDVLPVRSEALQRFVDGSIAERDFAAASLHPPEERALVRDLYIESIIVLGASKAVHDGGVAALLRPLPSIFASLGEPERLRDVYAAGATPAGNRFLQRLGFERMGEDERADHLLLYRAPHARLVARL